MNFILRIFKAIVPKPVYRLFAGPYHYLFALLGALIYRYPSRKLFVVAVTGTKGKSSTAEILARIFEEAGLATALASTIRFSINGESNPNLFKMTMPGRFFLQRFLRKAVNGGATHAVIEMTSEGVLQSRHKFIDLDALIFTNIAREHIESHGSFENYLQAKLEIAKALECSSKKVRYVVANADDRFSTQFLDVDVEHKLPYSLSDANPYTVRANGIGMTYENTYMSTTLRGVFNLSNILAAITLARAKKINIETIRSALSKIKLIPGRVEEVDAGQPCGLFVDYAHTPESLEALYKAFPKERKICVLGNTGGGRDTWKRPVMGAIADKYCDEIILTDEDPYDEDPGAIVDAMKKDMRKHTPHVEMDRREAISHALRKAKRGDVVLITGKGTDPFIMRARGKKEPWNDSRVAKEEVQKLVAQNFWKSETPDA